MKKLLLHNKYLTSSLLVLTAFILFTSHLFTLFSLIPLFFVVIKYKFKTYAPFSLLALSGIFFFLKYINADIEDYILVPVLLLFPVLIFKLTFKDMKFSSFNKTFYIFLTYSLTIVLLIIILLQFNYFNELFQKMIKSNLDESFNFMMNNMQSQNKIADLKEIKILYFNLLKNYFPFIIFYIISIFIIFNFLFGTFFISKNIAKKPVFINIFFIKTPEHYIWIFLSACLLAFVSFYYKNPLFKFITRNFALISAFIYIIEGGLIFLYKFLIIKMNMILKSLTLFIGIYLFIKFQMILFVPIILAGLGILDYWFDFRKTDQFKKNNIDTMV